MIITRKHAMRLLRTGRAQNPAALRPDDRGRVYVAIDVNHRRLGWVVRHYLEN
jgi:hypothetical protein